MPARSLDATRLASASARIRSVAADRGLAGIVLTTPGSVAWATSGINEPIDRVAAVDVVWVAVSAERMVVVTTSVEGPRLTAEYAPGSHGLDVVAVPWWDTSAFVTAAATALGIVSDDLGSDGHPAFGHDVSHQLTAARLALDPAEQESLRELGREAADAVQSALRGWRPGDTDREVAAGIAGRVERVGAQAPVLLVGGDERLRRFRHPVAVGDPLYRDVMAVLVAARGGLHVALTRYASAATVDVQLSEQLAATRRISTCVLAASRPGAVVGDILTTLAAAYADEGAAGAWREHYQGGVIGYGQREFEISPGQGDSPWWPTALPAAYAVAWNPSLAGGAKDEDTYLITGRAPEPITVTTDWPLCDEYSPARPDVLVVGA